VLFNSYVFVLFFAIFLPVYLVARKNLFARNTVLILASYVFYGWWDPRFLILVAVSTSVDYVAALGAAGKPVPWIERLKSAAFLVATTVTSLAFANQSDYWIFVAISAALLVAGLTTLLIDRAAPLAARKYWLLFSLFTNLGILAVFKYFNFFVSTLGSALAATGFTPDITTLSIILPVGLSFYTFQAISRTIDSYRGKFDPAYSITNYAAYHAFFPQLVAGPIERAWHLMPQFEELRPLDIKTFISGVELFVWGLYLKLVVADNLAPLANSVFNEPAGKSGAETAVAILAFTFQIYGDFCGYSNMARGLARCLGFDLMANFNLPYFARSPSEFWQRWHISLSSWLRDYLYIPLGGNRFGQASMYKNLMLTMLLGGLWHGAAWTFVVWGAFHGFIQVVFRALSIDTLLERLRIGTARGLPLHLLGWLVTFCLVMIGWVFFRARTFEGAAAILANVTQFDSYAWNVFRPLVGLIVPMLIAESYLRMTNRQELALGQPFAVRYLLALFLFFSILVLHAPATQEFIYFDF
jgi:alginate O-acetyltransferase complex protein AlgI